MRLVGWDELPRAAAIVAAVSHGDFARRSLDDIAARLSPSGVYVDVKSQADADGLRERGIDVWRL